MKKKKEPQLHWIGILALVALILVAVASYGGDKKDAGQNLDQATGGEAPLVLEHDYVADANTYRGSFMAESPCREWETDIEFSDSDPEQIKLIFEVEEENDECEPRPVRKDFTFLIPSSEQARLVAVQFNGQLLAFTVKDN